MRTLAIDCATEACSVALFDDGQLVTGEFAVLGRGHAERLVPMIAALPEKGRADRIVVSRGPGSFTGVRIGIAAARALALAWGAPCLGYPTLALVAAQAQERAPGPVTVCMHGGHGEWFVQNFSGDGAAQDQIRSLAPQAAREATRHPTLAGSRADELAALFESATQQAFDILPDARATHLLRDETVTSEIGPIYGRAPDARRSA